MCCKRIRCEFASVRPVLKRLSARAEALDLILAKRQVVGILSVLDVNASRGGNDFVARTLQKQYQRLVVLLERSTVRRSFSKIRIGR